MGLMMAACAAGSAQEITVPAQNSTRPLWVDVSTHNGSITVKTYNGKEVIVQGGNVGRDRDRGAPPAMKRLDMPNRGVSVEAADNRVTIRDNSPGGGDSITVTVPVETSLQLNAHNGNITVDGVHGEVDADSHNGPIRLTNISGTVVASARNAGLTVTMDRLDASKPSSFSSVNGTISVTLPPDVKANLKMRSDNGGIYSDFDVNMTGGGAMTRSNTDSRGRYRIDFDRTMLGTINGGGTELTFTTVNGSIYIKKK
jgi:DUF4097 and DUF4098 domain-containing protein YvlB